MAAGVAAALALSQRGPAHAAMSRAALDFAGAHQGAAARTADALAAVLERTKGLP